MLDSVRASVLAMNNHDYHIINEDSLRSSSNNHQEFFQSYLSNNNGHAMATDKDKVNGKDKNLDTEANEEKLETAENRNCNVVPFLGLKQSYVHIGNECTMKYRFVKLSFIKAFIIYLFRNIGKNGLRVPLLAFSSWDRFGQLSEDSADEILTIAYKNGINYFDTGDAFCNGQSELMLGNILKKKKWPRSSYIVSSKIFWKTGPSTHLGGGLSRKFIIEALEATLQRLQIKYIDILIIHKLDAMCPMEEIVITQYKHIYDVVDFYFVYRFAQCAI